MSGTAGATGEDPDDTDLLAIDVQPMGARTVVTLRGELDMSGVVTVAARMAEALARPDVIAVDLDLGAVTFLDSAGLNCLLKAQADAGAAGIPLRVAEASAGVRRVVEMAGVPGLVADPG